MNLKGSKTEKNLLKTFAGEARARDKYDFYAERARMDGFQHVAQVFEETANNEKAHARETFNRYLRLNNTTADNLLDAARGEAAESSKIYKDFSDTARREGFNEIADFYKELSEVEESHEKRFMELRRRIRTGTMFKDDKLSKWRCLNCGYIHVGEEAPLICPLCKYPRAYFELYCDAYKGREE